jgi:hypothetical protein
VSSLPSHRPRTTAHLPSPMWLRRIIALFLGIVAGLFDVTVAVWFPGNLTAIRIGLPLVALIAAFSVQERSLVAAVGVGIVADTLMPSTDFVTIRLLIIALAVHALAQRLFTNRSLPGVVALGIIALALDRTLLALYVFAQQVVGRSPILELHAALWAEALWMVFVMTVVFLLFVAFTRRFLPPLTRNIGSTVKRWR